MNTLHTKVITTADELIAAISAPPKHNYPYRVFVAGGDCRPYLESSVLTVCRGDIFFRHPSSGPMFCRLDGEQTHLALEEWLHYVGRVVELHPSAATTFPTTTGQETRAAADYMGALCVALHSRMRAFSGLSERRRAALRRLDELHQQRIDSEMSRSVAYWHGVSVNRGQFLALRRIFKDPAFIEAYKEAVVAGDYGPLKDYLNDCGCDWFFDDSWLRRRTDGMLVRADCGHVEFFDEAVTTQNGNCTYCRSCADEEFVYVDACRPHETGWYHRDHVYYWDSDGEYHLEPEPEPEDECYDGDDACGGLLCSWSESTAQLDHDKSFVPSWYGDFTIGIELEVETEDYDRYDAVCDCDGHFNCDGQYAMFKRDGSLDDARGFEIVTAARRLGDHLEMFKDWTPYEGLRSWSAGCCGMHVHIDSRAFTALSLGKFLQFFNDERNAKFIRSIAGRHPDMDGQASSYAARVECDNPNPARIKKGAGTSRYRMVNLTNLTVSEQRRLAVATSRESKGSYSTVELRIFRGTLKKERLLAQIEFAHASVVFCRVAGIHQLTGPGFISWLGSVAGQYKHLARWFGVYVPRPTKQRPAPAVPNASCAAGV